MVLKSPVARAASVAAMMSVIAIPFAVLSQPAPVYSAAPYSIHDLAIAKGTETKIDASHLGPFRVNSSVNSVVYATYSNTPKFIHLRGDQEGPSVITVTDEANGSIVEQFKVHVLDDGPDDRIDIGDVTRYAASRPAEVTQADVRTLLNGIEPFNKARGANKPPGIRDNAIKSIQATQNAEFNTEIDLTTVFTDESVQLLSFAIDNIMSLPSGLKASVSGQVLTVSGTPTVSGDQFNIVIKATDPSGLSANHTIQVHVVEQTSKPAPKVINGNPGTVRLINGYPDEPKTVNTATYFSDSTALSYELVPQSLPAYLNASINQSTGELTISGANLTEDVPRIIYLQVKATNIYSLSATLDVPVSIEIPPTVIHNQHSWMPFLVSLNDLFADIRASQFEITKAPEAGLIATIQNNGNTDANILFQGTIKNTFLKVKGTNPATGTSKEEVIRIKINYHPALADVAVQPVIVENGTLASVSRDLKGLFKDEAGQALVYSIDETAAPLPQELSIYVQDGVLNVTGVPTGTEDFKIPVKATDPYGLSNGRNIEVKVVKSPKDMGGESIEWIHGVTAYKTLDAAAWVNDSKSEFKYTLDTPAGVTASINNKTGKILIERVDPSVIGTFTVKVTATNIIGSSATVNIPINIKQVITIPWNPNLPFPYTEDVSSYFSDMLITRFEVNSDNSKIKTDIISSNGNTYLQFSGDQGETNAADSLTKVTALNGADQILKETVFQFKTDYPAPVMKEGKVPETIELTNAARFQETFSPYLTGYFSDLDIAFEKLPYKNIEGDIFAAIRDNGGGKSLEVSGAYFPANESASTYLDVRATNGRNKSTVISFPVIVKERTAPDDVNTPDTLVFQDGINTSYRIYPDSFFNHSDLKWDILNENELKHVYNIRASMDGETLYVENLSRIYNSEVQNLAVIIKATDEFNQSAELRIPIQINPVTK